MAQIGDIVRYLNSVGGGRVTRIEGNMAYVDDDGFETPVLLRECVVVTPAAAVPKASKEVTAVAAKTASRPAAAPTPAAAPQPVIAEADEEPVEETDYGNRLNITLAFEPADIKRLSESTYDAYLVNDSNYYLYFTFLSRAEEAGGWTTRYAGIVEPNIQVWLGELTRDDLPQLDRIAVQYIAFKRDQEFDLKAPVAVETKVDTTKFVKLHCFHDNIYFDKPVIAFDIVKNDIPQRQRIIDSSRLEEGIKAKKAVDRPQRRPVVRKQRRQSNSGVIEVDLHIHELVDNTRGLSPADMLNLQVDEFRRVMDANLKNKGQKIVFIHGKGEGVLRQALMKELNYRYKGHQVQDASFREYGYGATQVTI